MDLVRLQPPAELDMPIGEAMFTQRAIRRLDPNRPITINAHITIDVKGMKDTAVDIEDYVSGKDDELEFKGDQ